MTRILDSWETLQTLDLALWIAGPSLHYREYDDLARIPKVAYLRLWTTDRLGFVEADDAITRVLDHRRVLHFSSLPAGVTSSLLRMGLYPALRELHISGASPMSILPLLDSKVGHGSLRCLTMQDSFTLSRASPNESTIIRFDHLRPLLAFRYLESLVLLVSRNSEGAYGFSLNDAAWRNLAEAFPRLHTICVRGDPKIEMAPEFILPTYMAIVHLVRHCHRLTTIALVIADDASEHDPQEMADLPTGIHVQNLSLLHSRIRDYGFVENCITAMFPFLTTLSRRVYDLDSPPPSLTGEVRLESWDEPLRKIQGRCRPS